MDDNLQLELFKPTLLIIDMQNGFCNEQGSLSKAGVNVSYNKAIIQRIKRLVRSCREAKMHIIWSQQKHFADDITRQRHKLSTHLHKMNVVPCIKNTWDAEIVDELKSEIRDEDDIVEKHRSSCFYDTTLHTKLRMHGIDLLVITGVASEYCVENTIRHAYHMDYDMIVVKDCILLHMMKKAPSAHYEMLKNGLVWF